MNGESRKPGGTPMSPCTKICVMDAVDRFCTGCGRTRQEIAEWWTLRDDAKWAVLASLGARQRPTPPTTDVG